MGGCNCPGAKEKSRRFYRHRNNFDLFMQGFKSLVVMTLTLFLVFSFMGNCNSAPQVITSKNWGSSMRWLPPSFLLPSLLFLLSSPSFPSLSFVPSPPFWFISNAGLGSNASLTASSSWVVETLWEKELDSSSYALPEGCTYVPNTLLFWQW